MRCVRWSSVLLTASLMVGCSAAAAGMPAAAATPLPADTLLDGPPKVSPEAGGASALLVAHTKFRANCRVYFGTTPAATDGWATDNGMSGGPRMIHKAVLLGLRPATRYWYRFVGSDASGRNYAGVGGSFRTGPAPHLPGGHDLARSARVTAVSSEYSTDYAAANAIDGNPATEWSTKGDGDHASITLDLGHRAQLTGVGFRTRQMSDGSSIVKAINVVVDGHKYGPFTTTPGLSVIKLRARGRMVRIDVVHSTGGNTGAQDIAVYGT